MESPTVTGNTCVRVEVDEEKIHSLHQDIASNDYLVALTAFMRAAGSETRMRILYLLWRTEELCVCDLADILDLTTPAISQQLKKLRKKDLVASRRDAQTIYYRINAKHVFAKMLVGLFEKQEGKEFVPLLNGSKES